MASASPHAASTRSSISTTSLRARPRERRREPSSRRRGLDRHDREHAVSTAAPLRRSLRRSGGRASWTPRARRRRRAGDGDRERRRRRRDPRPATSRRTSTPSSTRSPACSTRSAAGASATRRRTRSRPPAVGGETLVHSATATSVSTSSAAPAARGRAALGGARRLAELGVGVRGSAGADDPVRVPDHAGRRARLPDLVRRPPACGRGDRRPLRGGRRRDPLRASSRRSPAPRSSSSRRRTRSSPSGRSWPCPGSSGARRQAGGRDLAARRRPSAARAARGNDGLPRPRAGRARHRRALRGDRDRRRRRPCRRGGAAEVPRRPIVMVAPDSRAEVGRAVLEAVR